MLCEKWLNQIHVYIEIERLVFLPPIGQFYASLANGFYHTQLLLSPFKEKYDTDKKRRQKWWSLKI